MIDEILNSLSWALKYIIKLLIVVQASNIPPQFGGILQLFWELCKYGFDLSCKAPLPTPTLETNKQAIN